jgi:hypothetical protein
MVLNFSDSTGALIIWSKSILTVLNIFIFLARGFLAPYPMIPFNFVAEGLRSVWLTLDLEVMFPGFFLSKREICVVLVLLVFMTLLSN